LKYFKAYLQLKGSQTAAFYHVITMILLNLLFTVCVAASREVRETALAFVNRSSPVPRLNSPAHAAPGEWKAGTIHPAEAYLANGRRVPSPPRKSPQVLSDMLIVSGRIA
jgi:hypothetical protein